MIFAFQGSYSCTICLCNGVEAKQPGPFYVDLVIKKILTFPKSIYIQSRWFVTFTSGLLIILINKYVCIFFFRFNVPNGCSVELSHKGYQFLTNLFERYDKDKDNALSPKEVEVIFSTCPTPAFTSCVQHMVPTNSKVRWSKDFYSACQKTDTQIPQGWITLDGWICFWTYTTTFDYPTTLEYLAYFGYPINDNENQCTAIQGNSIYCKYFSTYLLIILL